MNLELVPCPIDITRPRWDQHTFRGRFYHFGQITNPLLLLRPRKDLDSARHLYQMAKYATAYARVIYWHIPSPWHRKPLPHLPLLSSHIHSPSSLCSPIHTYTPWCPGKAKYQREQLWKSSTMHKSCTILLFIPTHMKLCTQLGGWVPSCLVEWLLLELCWPSTSITVL